MYFEFFSLREPPFRLTPDPQFLFASKQHARAKAYMESTIWLADGFVVITGDIGSGKTTLIESFLEYLPEDVVLAQISQTQISPVEFLQSVLVEFGFQPFNQRKVELLSMLKDFMIDQYANGKKLLLVIDEAQNLSRKVLEEVRLLSGIEAQKEKLLRIILAGQPELSEKLDSPRLEQLTQRVRLRFHLSALSKRETQEYITHRLEVAGANGRKIFDEAALDTVFRYSGGVPRLTNVLCDTAMLCGFSEEKDTVDQPLIMAAIEELQWKPYAERASANNQNPDDTGRFTAYGAPLARFEILFRDKYLQDFEMALGRSIIGRTTDNDLQIRSQFISRHHAQIITSRDRSVIEDLNSTNGVFIDSKRLKQHILVEGDVLQLGEHRLIYRDMRSNFAKELSKNDVVGEDVDEDEEDDAESELEPEISLEDN